MAKITDVVGTEILMPVLQHRWRFVVNSRKLEGKITNVITLQVINCNVDYKNKTIAVNIEENITGSVSEELFRLIDNELIFQCRIDAMDGDNGVYFSTEFIGSSVDKHNVEFNYAKDGTVKHELLIKFSNIILLYPEDIL